MEIEVKVEISPSEISEVRDRLLKMKARCLAPRQEEENLLFDFSDLALRKSGCALRLRRYGRHIQLTFKGPVVDHPFLKKREELESEVADFDSLRRILEKLGLEVCFGYSKFREIYRLTLGKETVELSLDETPIGCFVEIEGSEAAIYRVTETLEWPETTFIRKNYVELYQERAKTKV